MIHAVEVKLDDGTVIDTWSRYEITIDMLQPGNAWTFELYGSDFRRTSWLELLDKARHGRGVIVKVDGATQIRGLIERRHETSDEHGVSMVIGGRDTSAILIDSDADPNIHLRGLTLGDAVEKLVPLGVNVRLLDGAAVADVHALRKPTLRKLARHPRKPRTPVDLFKIQPGERIWQVIDALCRKSGFRVWVAPYPGEETGIGLVIDRPRDDAAPVGTLLREYADDSSLRYRGNVLRAKYGSTTAGVPTVFTSFAHTALGTAGQDAKARTVVENTKLEHRLVVPRADLPPRPRYLNAKQARTAAGARKLAERAIAQAMEDFVTYEAVVQGHAVSGAPDARLWAVNTTARVKDIVHNLDETMLVTRVSFRGDRSGGTTTQIRCVPRGMIAVVPDET